MMIDVYADSTGLFTEDLLNRMDSNMIAVEVDDEIVHKFFIEECLEDFRPDVDEGVSDDGLFEEWLDEYTCDDTEELYEYACEKGKRPLIDGWV